MYPFYLIVLRNVDREMVGEVKYSLDLHRNALEKAKEYAKEKEDEGYTVTMYFVEEKRTEISY